MICGSWEVLKDITLVNMIIINKNTLIRFKRIVRLGDKFLDFLLRKYSWLYIILNFSFYNYLYIMINTVINLIQKQLINWNDLNILSQCEQAFTTYLQTGYESQTYVMSEEEI